MYSKYEALEAIWLERLSWVEAETLFKQDRTVVIPLGAAAKQHGPHLPLNNDALIAQWLAEEVAQALCRRLRAGATLATAEKGRAVATALLDQVLQDIEKML